MTNEFSRAQLLLGAEGMEKLKKTRVAVFGVGGVGGYACEALARSGVGAIDLIDHDTVSLTNINRQIIALHSTIGRYKCDVMKDRILDINPSCQVTVYNTFYTKENADSFDLSLYDYIVDAIDTVSAKLMLIEKASAANTPIISSMGAGNKLDPTRFEVADIYSTSVCPLARVMRKELKKRGIEQLKVVYSKEEALSPVYDDENAYEDKGSVAGRPAPGSVAFVPSVAGLILAGEVVKDLIK
ncbi:MAG: tRNA threonylcarbamoyladenosine dehydratase [Ruminococcus sp.]|nr:tRNA threonylcarbamoyladenosine dehydratase [Ruminococcus sp.]